MSGILEEVPGVAAGGAVEGCRPEQDPSPPSGNPPHGQVPTHGASVGPRSTRQGARPGLWEGGMPTPWGWLWRLGVAGVLAWFFLGGVWVTGWVLRICGWATGWWWWRTGPARRAGMGFEKFCSGHSGKGDGWRFPGAWRGDPDADRWGRRVWGGVTDNFRVGAAGLFNVWVWTLPGQMLWVLGWHAGWQNSFHKAYELSEVGPLLFIAGKLWFIAAMFHVPMALARQASTGDWRSFYRYREIWGMIRRRWLAVTLLAGGYTLLALPLNALKTAPWAFGNEDWVSAMSPETQLRFISVYYLGMSGVGVTLLLVLRLWGAWVHAGALRDAVRDGSLAPSQLAPGERWALEKSGWLGNPQAGSAHPFWQRICSVGNGIGWGLSLPLVAFLWWTFVAQIVVGEFLNSHRFGRGWWNQPLIQVPWFDYTPTTLRDLSPSHDGSLPL